MSAQAGIWNIDGRPVDPQLVSRFGSILKLQGPDGEFCWSGDSVAMVYFPFYTTPQSHCEKQPLCSRRGSILTWDGRLDNRDELTADLKGDLEPDASDASIVAAAFDRWETGCFRRMIGDWALSIWRPRERELIFAIDRLAIRHIFYSFTRSTVWWATDIAPLVLFSPHKLHIDDEYIAGYFTHDAECFETPYQEIRQVPAGCLARIGDRGAKIERYRQFDPHSRIRHKTDADYEDHFRYLFRQSVRRRLRSDRPILAELSGGIDSSSIICMADDILSKEGVALPRLDTVSYYDRTEPDGDDHLYFPKVEEKRQRAGWHFDVSKQVDSHGELEYREFEPLPGSLGIGRELADERAAVVNREGYRVVLSGIGGDEFLGGIPNPYPQLGDLIVQFKIPSLVAQLMTWGLAKRKPWVQLLWRALLELLPPSLGQHFSALAKAERWIETAFARTNKIPLRILDVRDHFGFWLPTRRAFVGGVVLMQNCMAKRGPSSLALEEPRYPYLDQDLIEFLLAIPATQLLRPGERRSLMRRSLAGIVPQEILSRRTKHFGARTHIVALEPHWQRINELFRTPQISHRGYVNRERFLEALRAARSGLGVHTKHLLRTISLELWLVDLLSRGLIVEEPAVVPGLAAECLKAAS